MSQHLSALIAHAQKSKSKKNFRLAGTWIVLDAEKAEARGLEPDHFQTVSQAYSKMFTKSMMEQINWMKTNTWNGTPYRSNHAGLGYGEIIVYDMESGEVVFHEVRQD